MPGPASRRAALIAAATLIGPTIPPALMVSRPQEAATACKRMADLLLPWLDGASTTAPSEAAATGAEEHPATGGTQHDRSEGPCP